ncbi:uncharacterized protein LOC133204868 [Saccostrea echinata]|uniref:uncharacterized protein LOC133204868 n=1 Tax=Saccostrea echinata TaxID=191078 RepID=UPI002A813D02|nr:uncharacterized protein LOC133204868 [Saccostrea echinata]
MFSLVAVSSLVLLLHTVTGQMHSQRPGMQFPHTSSGQMNRQASTGMQTVRSLGACSCQIRCCPDHTSPRRLPPYTNLPHIYSSNCCGCVYCPSFIGPGPFFPMGWPMLTPLSSIQMAMATANEPPEAPDAPDTPDVPDAPELEGPEVADPPELEGQEIEGDEEIEGENVET